MSIKDTVKKIPGMSYIAEKRESFMPRLLSGISPLLASKYVYRKRLGKRLDIKNPKLYNERLMWLKLYYYNKNPLVTECADKYRVRNYLERCGLGDSLNELYGVWDNADDIPWDSLPDKFVLKCNHGCDYNIICEDKSKLDIKEAKKKLKKWLRDDFWKYAAEVNYRYIPKRIICEKYIGTEDGGMPADIKVYCFNGVPKLVGYYYDRPKYTHDQKMVHYDFDWNPVPFMHPKYRKGAEAPEKPAYLERVLKEAEILSKPFPFVRVDFFEYKGQPVFAELTFTPLFCAGDLFTDEGMEYLGSLIKLPIDSDKSTESR